MWANYLTSFPPEIIFFLSCTLNEPSPFTKSANLLPFMEILANIIKNVFVISLQFVPFKRDQLLFNLQVLDREFDFQSFFQKNDWYIIIFVHDIL